MTRISRKYYAACRMVILFFVLPLLLATFYILPVYAAEGSPSADIKSKLEELKKEIASKAAKLKNEVDKKLKDKAYAGKVKSSSVTSITLATRSGPRIVSVNQDTVFESQVKLKKKFSQKSVAAEDYLAALGDIDETGVLIAKKVILLPDADSEVKTYLWGQVVAISDKLITIKNKDLKNMAVSLKSNSPLKLNDFIILTGFRKSEVFEAEFVFVSPQGGILKPKRALYPASGGSTPSGSVKVSTPSGKKN